MATQTDLSAKPRTPLSRERVLRAALALADVEGIGSLTMRRLGQELGVEAMSLYNHVADKGDLLDGIVDLVFGEIAVPSDQADWKAAMRLRAISAHEALLRHPWASNLMQSRTKPGPATLRHHDSVIGTLRDAGFTVEMAAHAFSVIDSYIYGFGRQQLNMSSRRDIKPEEMAEAFLRAIPADEYPYLREMVVEYAMNSGHDESADFEFGLNLILDGLQTLLD